MPRFFVDPAHIGTTHISLDAEDLAHIRVLRLGPKETFVVSDGKGMDYRCVLDGDQAKILERAENSAEPKVCCTVYLALTRGERMDYAIQKSVELGAQRIVLFPAKRCVVRYEGKDVPKKLARLQKIALEAAKQSGRGIVPAVTAASDFRSAMTEAALLERALFFYENETRQGLRAVLDARPEFRSASLVIGPAGGFADEEAVLAEGLGLVSVTLGPRILRAETAPAVALAAVLFYAGDL